MSEHGGYGGYEDYEPTPITTYPHVGVVFAVVMHGSGNGDFGGYVSSVMTDHVYISFDAATFMCDQLNRPTLDRIASDPKAELSERYLGYAGRGLHLPFFTVEQIQTRSIIRA